MTDGGCIPNERVRISMDWRDENKNDSKLCDNFDYSFLEGSITS